MIISSQSNSLKALSSAQVKPASLEKPANPELVVDGGEADNQASLLQADSYSFCEFPPKSGPGAGGGYDRIESARSLDAVPADGESAESAKEPVQEPAERSIYDLDAVPVDGDGFGAGGGYNKIQESTEKSPESSGIDTVDGDGFGSGGGYCTLQGGGAYLISPNLPAIAEPNFMQRWISNHSFVTGDGAIILNQAAREQKDSGEGRSK